VTSNANLYAVTAGSVSSQRVRTFIDFLAENLVADRLGVVRVRYQSEDT
jgi:hypothetical protein